MELDRWAPGLQLGWLWTALFDVIIDDDDDGDDDSVCSQ